MKLRLISEDFDYDDLGADGDNWEKCSCDNGYVGAHGDTCPRCEGSGFREVHPSRTPEEAEVDAQRSADLRARAGNKPFDFRSREEIQREREDREAERQAEFWRKYHAEKEAARAAGSRPLGRGGADIEPEPEGLDELL